MSAVSTEEPDQEAATTEVSKLPPLDITRAETWPEMLTVEELCRDPAVQHEVDSQHDRQRRHRGAPRGGPGLPDLEALGHRQHPARPLLTTTLREGGPATPVRLLAPPALKRLTSA